MTVRRNESVLAKLKGQSAGFVAGLVAGAAAAISLGGCAGAPQALVDASDRFANRTVGPEYLAYVEADGSLTAEEKQLRRDNVASFRRAVGAAKGEATPPAPTPPTPVVEPIPGSSARDEVGE